MSLNYRLIVASWKLMFLKQIFAKKQSFESKYASLVLKHKHCIVFIAHH